MIDVVVVGGGPAGCHAASLLAQRGLDVHVLEEHSEIGQPVDCSGIIGAESYDYLKLPETLKLGQIDKITFVSPSDLTVKFSRPSPLAYVVDRAAFDRLIADRTRASGGVVHLKCRTIDIEVQQEWVDVIFEEGCGTDRQTAALRARVAVLAHGPRYALQRRLGMGEPDRFLRTAQTEVDIRGITETQVLMGSQVAPGSFAWVVPFRRQQGLAARVGVSTNKSPAAFLKRLLNRLYAGGHIDSPEVPFRSWVIPLSPIAKTYSDRVLAVGDAAGQTKPTTGGGIFYALLSAEALAGSVAAAFEKEDFSAASMARYQREWRKKLGREMRLGAFLRHLAERLTDGELDELFRIVNSDGILPRVTREARFDWHSGVISFILRHPALGKVFLKGLFR